MSKTRNKQKVQDQIQRPKKTSKKARMAEARRKAEDADARKKRRREDKPQPVGKARYW